MEDPNTEEERSQKQEGQEELKWCGAVSEQERAEEMPWNTIAETQPVTCLPLDLKPVKTRLFNPISAHSLNAFFSLNS